MNEDFFCKKNRISAFHRSRSFNKTKCPSCDLFGCICQSDLKEFLSRPVPKFFKNRCVKCKLFLCNCIVSGRGEKL